MAFNNLRVIYTNLADSATLSSVSTTPAATPVTNLQKDQKGAVWRSPANTVAATQIQGAILVDLGSSQSIGGVVLPFTNLNSAAATITVQGYSAVPTITANANGSVTVTGGTLVVGFSQTGVCSPWNTLGLGTGSPNTYAYGGGTCARLWLSTSIQALQARYILITITDYYSTSATGRYIEASRLVIGNYWSPTYNTGYGMTSTIKDLSVHDRTESGDLVTQRGPRYNSLAFDLAWVSPKDRVQLTKLFLGNGISKALFISLFPDNGSTTESWEQERAHQIYGKVMQIPGISYHTLEMYSAQLEIEEV